MGLGVPGVDVGVAVLNKYCGGITAVGAAVGVMVGVLVAVPVSVGVDVMVGVSVGVTVGPVGVGVEVLNRC